VRAVVVGAPGGRHAVVDLRFGVVSPGGCVSSEPSNPAHRRAISRPAPHAHWPTGSVRL